MSLALGTALQGVYNYRKRPGTGIIHKPQWSMPVTPEISTLTGPLSADSEVIHGQQVRVGSRVVRGARFFSRGVWRRSRRPWRRRRWRGGRRRRAGWTARRIRWAAGGGRGGAGLGDTKRKAVTIIA